MVQDSFDPDSAACHDGVFGLPVDPEAARFVLIPVPFDATTSYRRGTADAPQAILEASWQVDLCDVETGDPWRAGVHMLPIPDHLRRLNREARDAVDRCRAASPAGSDGPARARVDEIGEAIVTWTHEQSSLCLRHGKIPGVVGGDHACPLGAIIACAEHHPGLGILHIDAHADLRVAYEGFAQSHASIMHNALERAPGIASLVQVGVRDLGSSEQRAIAESAGRIRTFFDADLARASFDGRTFASCAASVVEALPESVYVSFDIDGLDPSLCPHTGTPVPGGLSFQQASFLLGTVARSGRRIVGFDLCEVGPGSSGDIDAIVGARVLYKLIGWSWVASQR